MQGQAVLTQLFAGQFSTDPFKDQGKDTGNGKNRKMCMATSCHAKTTINVLIRL